MRVVISSLVMGTSLLGALLSFTRLQLQTAIILLLLWAIDKLEINKRAHCFDKEDKYPLVLTSEMADTVECIAALLESCLASVIMHWGKDRFM